MSETFKNYNNLLEANENLARELLASKGEGKWQNEEIYQHEDVEAFAENELTEGWYADLRLGEADFKGAPNPMDFIDLEALGNALVRSWDDSCNFESESGEILSTGYGW